MKHSHLFTILAAAYIAPHVSPGVGICVGIYFGAMAIYYVWSEA
jgi:hypothetical protein